MMHDLPLIGRTSHIYSRRISHRVRWSHLTHHTTGSASGTRRSRRHAQAGDPRPPGPGSTACAAAPRLRRDLRRPPGKAL
ncbi:hypothetical protein SBRY_30763 [Actinacidiphila bryophytorum]|uniref:Uncharacterized protein n=1 Tax=Actinacidiphila bryophytorum TaxID=1436133 RepID=A0A9W4H1L5_9ACTN|nr:hypothetical protein SBRY_30763 [Actinacidiphila bryophytorum]